MVARKDEMTINHPGSMLNQVDTDSSMSERGEIVDRVNGAKKTQNVKAQSSKESVGNADGMKSEI